MCVNDVEHVVNNQILDQTCKHGVEHIKLIQNMQICPKGMAYCMELVESGDIALHQCEPCLIAWLCGDPMETCMNPEEIDMWCMQCVQPSQTWMEPIETTLNNQDFIEHIDFDEWYTKITKSMLQMVKKHGYVVKLVKMD